MTIGRLYLEMLRCVFASCGPNHRRVDLVCRRWRDALATSAWTAYLGAPSLLRLGPARARQLARCLHLGQARDFSQRLRGPRRFDECARVVVVMDRSVADDSPEGAAARRSGSAVSTDWAGAGRVVVRTEHQLTQTASGMSRVPIGHVLEFPKPTRDGGTWDDSTIEWSSVLGLTLRLRLVCPRRGICIVKGPGCIDMDWAEVEMSEHFPDDRPEYGAEVHHDGPKASTLGREVVHSVAGGIGFSLRVLVRDGLEVGLLVSWLQVTPGSHVNHHHHQSSRALVADNGGPLCDEVLDALEWQPWAGAE
jgi:hypothetical protein